MSMKRANNALQGRLLQQNEAQDLRRIRRTANQGYRQSKRRGDFAAALQFLTQAKDLTGATSNTNRGAADASAVDGLVQQNRNMQAMAGQASRPAGNIPMAQPKRGLQIGGLQDDIRKRLSDGVLEQDTRLGFSDGGLVPGLGEEDTIPAKLTPGEVVLTEQQQALVNSGMSIDQALAQTSAGNGLPPEEDGLVAESEMKTRMFSIGGVVAPDDDVFSEFDQKDLVAPKAPPVPGQSNKQLMDEAVRAGYTPSENGVAAYQKALHFDSSIKPESLEHQQAAQAGLQESMGLGADSTPAYAGPKRLDPNSARGMDERRAQAAIAPGMQQRLAVERDNRALVEQGRRTPEGENKDDIWYGRQSREAQQAERQNRVDGANAPTMSQLEGLPKDLIERFGWDPDASINDVNIELKKLGRPLIPLEPSAYDIFTKDARGRKRLGINTQGGRGRNERKKPRGHPGR